MSIIILFVHLYITGGSDYENGHFNVTFPAGVNVISFSVTIIDDIIAECAELFTLDLEIPAVAEAIGVLKGSPYNATVNIMDDDGECIHCMMPLSIQCDSELSASPVHAYLLSMQFKSS